MQKAFCEQIAAECARRAEEASDGEIREFFRRMRANWLNVAAGVEARQHAMPHGANVALLH
jgi:hypothetical protein